MIVGIGTGDSVGFYRPDYAVFFLYCLFGFFFFFKQKTAYYMRISDWSSDVCSSDLNYMSVYHDYLQQEYFGKPHEDGINGMLWGRSAIRFVDKVKTPIMLSHGDADLLVNPAEDEQYFIAIWEERREGKEGVSTCSSGWSPEY